MSERAPHILFIQADQLAAPALPCYGHPIVRAPRIAALAEAGVVFDAAYCNSPLCAPSRFSMLSGRLPSAIGAYDNAAEFPAAVPTFAHALRARGYRTVLAGKMHFVGPDQLHGFEERLTTDIYPADFGWTPDWRRPSARQDFFHTMLSVIEAGPCLRSMQLDFDDEVAFQAQRKIYDIARDGDQRPALLLVSFTHPHDPYTIGEAHWRRYRDDEIDPPAVPPLGRDGHDAHSRRIHDICGIDDWDLTEARVRAARRAYFGAIGYIDDQVGRLLDALRDSGLADNTVVVFTADHGDMLGERGLWYKMTFFEWAARVPLILYAPQRLAPRRVAAPVSLIDLFPSLIDLAGGDASDMSLPGRSLLPLAAGADADETASVAGEYLAEGAAGPLAMLRRGRWKYIEGFESPPQLFDLEADPRERNNLAQAPEQAEIAVAFAADVRRRWDFDALRETVLASQADRRRIFEALRQGAPAPWDHRPRIDASRQYARNRADILGDQERRARLPHRPAPSPDGPGRG